MKIKNMVFGVLIAAACLCSSYGWAMMETLNILNKKEIVKLTDAQLTDTYIDIIVEMEASRTFHTTSGFTPKEYEAYKDMLRYRIEVLMEMHKRGIEPPALDK